MSFPSRFSCFSYTTYIHNINQFEYRTGSLLRCIYLPVDRLYAYPIRTSYMIRTCVIRTYVHLPTRDVVSEPCTIPVQLPGLRTFCHIYCEMSLQTAVSYRSRPASNQLRGKTCVMQDLTWPRHETDVAGHTNHLPMYLPQNIYIKRGSDTSNVSIS